MTRKKVVSIEIDSLTNSIVNVRSGDIFETEFHLVSKKEIKKRDWLFDWGIELADKTNEVYKMTLKNNLTVIQGLISITPVSEEKYVFINLVENAKFNRGREKVYSGVGGNMFAFACKKSIEFGFDGYVGFIAKTSLIPYYSRTLGAELGFGQRMSINKEAANDLVKHYFKN
jgi:hypothetical protein